MSYGNQDGATPPDSPATSELGAPTVTTAEPPAASTVTVTAAAPVQSPEATRSRPIVLLGGATAVLVVFGLMMTGLFVFKSNQQTETSAKLATAQSSVVARDAKVTALQQQLAGVQSQLTAAQQRLTGAAQTAAATKTNRQIIAQCLKLVSQALTTARMGSASQLDAALKRLKAPCAKADKVA